MQDEQIQIIEVKGVKVEKIINSGYGLMLFANSKDFPNLDKKLKKAAESDNTREEPLVYISYYPPGTGSKLPPAINVSIWKFDTERLVWDGGKEHIAASEDEARRLVHEVMSKQIDYFRALDKQMEPEPVL